MQNKANLQNGRINLKSCNKKDYENKSNWTLGENKPNSNPIKANLYSFSRVTNKCLLAKQ